jgi:hypothetical protein
METIEYIRPEPPIALLGAGLEHLERLELRLLLALERVLALLVEHAPALGRTCFFDHEGGRYHIPLADQHPHVLRVCALHCPRAQKTVEFHYPTVYMLAV